MMKRIRAYFLFTSWRYKLGLFVAMPAVLIGCGLLWSRSMGQQGFAVIMSMGLLFTEILSDQCVFAGIQSKRSYQLDYLKTSAMGPGLLHQGLTGDLVRRLLTVVFCVGVCGALHDIEPANGWGGYVALVLVIYGMEVLGLLLTRYTHSMVLCMLIVYGCLLVGLPLVMMMLVVSEAVVLILDMILAGAAVVVSVVTVRTAMRSWQRTYADMHGKENEICN